MYLLSTMEVSNVSGGIDNVVIGTPQGGYVIVSTTGVSDQCAIAFSTGLNWSLEHPSVDSKANPYLSSIAWSCTQVELDNFIRNFEYALDN